MNNLIGQSFGRYQILEQIGEGGMATVYKAFDTSLDVEVAVKVIRTERLSPEISEIALKRFEREAKALAKLNHPNIVKVTDYGEYDGKPYLVMPYLAGGTLKELMNSFGALPWPAAGRLILPISKALEYAHQHGTIHRDIKPSNIIFTDSGEPMLSDFGIVKIMDNDDIVELTGANITIGTAEYMAPEQVFSKNVDSRADIYSLGVVYYELVTGHRPFQADTTMAVMFKHVNAPLPRPTQFVPNLPEKVEQVIFKALAKKPENRYASMADLASDLERISFGQPVAGAKIATLALEPPLGALEDRPVKIEESPRPYYRMVVKRKLQKPQMQKIILKKQG